MLKVWISFSKFFCGPQYFFEDSKALTMFVLKHESSIISLLSRGEMIKKSKEPDPIGILTRFVIKKNKLAPPFRTNYIPMIFGKGVDEERDAVLFAELLGVITKKGSFYSFKGETIGQGIDKASKTLLENPEMLDKIREMCYNIVLEPEKVGEDVEEKTE